MAHEVLLIWTFRGSKRSATLHGERRACFAGITSKLGFESQIDNGRYAARLQQDQCWYVVFRRLWRMFHVASCIKLTPLLHWLILQKCWRG